MPCGALLQTLKRLAGAWRGVAGQGAVLRGDTGEAAPKRRLRAGGFAWTLLGLPVYALALILSLPVAFWHQQRGRRAWDKTSRHAEGGDLSTATEGL